MVESGNVGDRHPGADCAHIATERQSAVLPEARDSLSDLDRGEDRKTQRKAEEGAHRDPLYVHALRQLTPLLCIARGCRVKSALAAGESETCRGQYSSHRLRRTQPSAPCSITYRNVPMSSRIRANRRCRETV